MRERELFKERGVWEREKSFVFNFLYFVLQYCPFDFKGQHDFRRKRSQKGYIIHSFNFKGINGQYG